MFEQNLRPIHSCKSQGHQMHGRGYLKKRSLPSMAFRVHSWLFKWYFKTYILCSKWGRWSLFRKSQVRNRFPYKSNRYCANRMYYKRMR